MDRDEIERIARRLYPNAATGGADCWRGRETWQSWLAQGLGISDIMLKKAVSRSEKSGSRRDLGAAYQSILRQAESLADQLKMWAYPKETLIIDRIAALALEEAKRRRPEGADGAEETDENRP